MFIWLQVIVCVAYFCVTYIRPLEPQASLELHCSTSENGEYGLNILVPINGDVFNQNKWPTTVPDELNIKNWIRCNVSALDNDASLFL